MLSCWNAERHSEMAPEKHALLSASAAHRWLNCPPSAQLCAAIPDTVSPYAEEGTQAHALCEALLNEAIARAQGKWTGWTLPYTDEMLEAASGYRDYVLEAVKDMDDPQICVEQVVNFSQWAPEGFGTVDCLAVGGDTMKIFDFKYGQGVEVYADWNPQMLCYALGGLAMFSPIYNIANIDLTIYQPRRNHISTFSLTTAELLIWAKDTLEPAAQQAYKGEGTFQPGEWCRFCKAKATCRALTAKNMELAQLEFPEPIGMSSAEIASVLPKLDMLLDWASSVKDYALDQALAGRKFPGYKLVEGRSNRRFKSEADACFRIKEAGFNPYITKMKGITELQKDMDRKQFEEVCGGLLEKPAGKPALVPVSDKRPEMDLSAAADFND